MSEIAHNKVPRKNTRQFCTPLAGSQTHANLKAAFAGESQVHLKK